MTSALVLALVAAGFVADADTPPWIRSSTIDGERTSLQIASRRYVGPEDSMLPDVWLVGVTHIGMQEYYRDLSALLQECDLVLYESVMPEGARSPGGEDDRQRAASTQAALDLLAQSATRCLQAGQPVPTDVDALRAGVGTIDLRLPGWVSNASVDAWGRPVRFEHDEAGASLRISSMGPDGEAGTADDLSSTLDVDVESAAVVEGNVNLQAMLAESLGLRYQLDTMPYDDTRWRVSDMSVEAVGASFAAKGMRFDELGDMLAGSSLPAQLIRAILALIPLGDALTGGSVSDGIQVVLIELLGTPGLLNLTEQQYGDGFNEVIIVERNTVPLEDLDRIIAEEPDIRHVAVLYGAAHMPDLAARLEAASHGYVVAETRWDDAMTVDMHETNLSPADFKSIRRSIRLSLASLKRQARKAREAEAAPSSD
jgi:hypothetical protein